MIMKLFFFSLVSCSSSIIVMFYYGLFVLIIWLNKYTFSNSFSFLFFLFFFLLFTMSIDIYVYNQSICKTTWTEKFINCCDPNRSNYEWINDSSSTEKCVFNTTHSINVSVSVLALFSLPSVWPVFFFALRNGDIFRHNPFRLHFVWACFLFHLCLWLFCPHH